MNLGFQAPDVIRRRSRRRRRMRRRRGVVGKSLKAKMEVSFVGEKRILRAKLGAENP